MRRRIRFARTALVPVHHHEIFFQCGVYVSERHLWKARAAVDKEQQRLRPVPTSNQNPLFRSAELDFFQRINPIRGSDCDLARDAALHRGAAEDDRHGKARKHSRRANKKRFQRSRTPRS